MVIKVIYVYMLIRQLILIAERDTNFKNTFLKRKMKFRNKNIPGLCSTFKLQVQTTIQVKKI